MIHHFDKRIVHSKLTLTIFALVLAGMATPAGATFKYRLPVQGLVSSPAVTPPTTTYLYLTNTGQLAGTSSVAGSGNITVRATYKGVSAEQTYQVTSLVDLYAANIWKDGSVCFVWAPGDGSYPYRCTSAGAVSSASWAHVAWVGNAGTVYR